MSREQGVRVTLSVDRDLDELLTDVVAAQRRAEKSEPGDRTDIVRYEALCASLEAKAATELARLPQAAKLSDPAGPVDCGTPFARIGSDRVIVALTLPLERGDGVTRAAGVEAPPPAAAWPVRDDLKGRQLVEQRFRDQLTAAVESPCNDRASVLSPSGIHNRVLTEVLREYVEGRGLSPVSVPVVYRDGSGAQAPFPLRCLEFSDIPLDRPDLELRLTLLSIRHTEMDPVVDGAWLRNAEVSRPRSAAQTDDFVYQTSARQLTALTRSGARRVRLRIFQTGLETAVVGFFRAVVAHLLAHPGTLEVVPMFYASRRKRDDGDAALEDDFAGFEEGASWATATGGNGV